MSDTTVVIQQNPVSAISVNIDPQTAAEEIIVIPGVMTEISSFHVI